MATELLVPGTADCPLPPTTRAPAPETSPNWLLASERLDAFLLSLPLAELVQALQRRATGGASTALFTPHLGVAVLLPLREEALVRQLLRLIPWLPLAVARACTAGHAGVLRVTGEWTTPSGERCAQVWTAALWSPTVSTALVRLAGGGSTTSRWVMVQQSNHG